MVSVIMAIAVVMMVAMRAASAPLMQRHEQQQGAGDDIRPGQIAESGLGRLNNHLRIKIRTWGGSHAHEENQEIEWEFDRL